MSGGDAPVGNRTARALRAGTGDGRSASAA